MLVVVVVDVVPSPDEDSIEAPTVAAIPPSATALIAPEASIAAELPPLTRPADVVAGGGLSCACAAAAAIASHKAP